MSEPELTRPVALATLKRPQSRHRVTATPAERAALAQRFGLLDLADLKAELTLEFLPGERELRVTGRLRATVTQACVVSLEPVVEQLDEPIQVDFSRDASDDPQDFALADSESAAGTLYEPWPGESLDLGELTAQELALSLNPYPRAPGARLPEAGSVADNPFAALRSRGDKGTA